MWPPGLLLSPVQAGSGPQGKAEPALTASQRPTPLSWAPRAWGGRRPRRVEGWALAWEGD